MKGPGAGAASLLMSVARALERGPRHTLELAREVLGLSGNSALASRVVFTLLSEDRRFQVDGGGNWRLADGAGPPLAHLPYAVVDLETTGGSRRRGHRITEVAVIRLEEGRVTERYETLVNPERPIPRRIQALTGISDEMVASAPPFAEVAPEVERRLRGRTFVAHNVPFDWGFLQGQLLETVGEVPELRRLCTVRLGRLLLPELRSHALDALTTHLGIRVNQRHRAAGDALATARLLLLLLPQAEARGIFHLDALFDVLSRPRRRTGRSRERGDAP